LVLEFDILDEWKALLLGIAIMSADFAEIAQQNGASRTQRGERVLVG